MKKLSIEEVQAMLLDLMKIVHRFAEENEIKYYLLGGSALGAVRHEGFIPWDDDIDIGMVRSEYERFLSIAERFDSKYEVINYRNAKNCDFGLTRIYIPNTYVDNLSVAKTKLDKRLYFDVFPLDNVPDDMRDLKKFEKQILRKKKMISRIDARDYQTSKSKLLLKQIVAMILRPFRQNILRSFDKSMQKYSDHSTSRICSLCSQYSFKKQVMEKSVYGVPTLHKFEDTELYIPENVVAYLTTLFGGDYMMMPPEEKRRKGYDIYLTNEEE